MPAFTVTVQQGGSTAIGTDFTLMVLTGQAASPIGISTGATSGTPSLTTGTGVSTGSWVYGALLGAAGTFAANGSTTFKSNTQRLGLQFIELRSTSTMTGGSAVTLGSSSGTGISISLLEILAGGGLAEDASSPGHFGNSSTSLASSSFTPPAGSLLVLMATTNGGASVTTVSVTDTSGLGLTWTERVKQNGTGNGYSGIWTAQLAGTPALAPPPYPPGFQSPAAFFRARRPAQQAPTIALSAGMSGAAAASAVMSGGRVISDALKGAAAASGRFSGVVAGKPLIYYPRLPGPVVRPISYASPSAQVPLAAFAAASGVIADARTAHGVIAGAAAASGSMAGRKQAAGLLAGNAAAASAIAGFQLGVTQGAAGYAAAVGVSAASRTAHGVIAGAAAASGSMAGRKQANAQLAAVAGAVQGSGQGTAPVAVVGPGALTAFTQGLGRLT